MNEVRKLYNDDGCVLKEASSNDYESWSSARTLGPMERRKEYRNLCYNFEYERRTNIPHCAKKGVCDEDYPLNLSSSIYPISFKRILNSSTESLLGMNRSRTSLKGCR